MTARSLSFDFAARNHQRSEGEIVSGREKREKKEEWGGGGRRDEAAAAAAVVVARRGGGLEALFT